MKRIDFSKNGGMPMSQQLAEFMQSSYTEALGAIAKAFGNKVILSGVVTGGGSVTDGWIVYNGELIQFEGGTSNTYVTITEPATALIYKDGISNTVKFTKKASVGAVGVFAFADLKRIEPIKDYWCQYDVKEVDCTADYILANFDSTGLGLNERKGWAICNGNHGTKNRGGRVSVGYNATDTDPEDNVWDVLYNTIGDIGGEKKHQLGADELPNPGSIPLYALVEDGTKTAILTDPNVDQPNIVDAVQIIPADANVPHNNLQPFIVTLFIQKL